MDFTFLQPFTDNPGSTTLGVIIIYLLWKIYNKPRNLPPGPKPWPLLGNLNYFRDDELRYRDYERLGREYGDVAMLYFGRRKHIVLNKWNVIKEAFVTRGLEFQDRDPALLGNDYEDFFDEVFNCPLSDDWQWKKKFALKALKNAGFGTKASEEKIIREVNELLSWIENHNGKSFDIEDALVNLHANVILSVLISKRYPWFTEGVERMIAAGREFYEVTQVCTSLTLDLAPQYIPMWLVKLIFRSRLKKHVYGGFENSRSIVYEAIAEKRKEQLDPHNPRDFLEAYMTQREDFDEKVFTSTVCIFMPDAIDSLSSLGLWILLHLAYNPDVQKKCQAEIDEMCGTRQPHLVDRGDLNWVEASILEGTRLGTPLLISLAHIVTKNTQLRGYTIPRKNTCVIANLYAGNRDPEVFPDPERFDPKRFLDEHGKFHRADHVVSYGIGKRMCVGKAMSEVELFLIISNILQRYTVSFPEDQPNPSTVSMKGNLFRRPYPYKLVTTPR